MRQKTEPLRHRIRQQTEEAYRQAIVDAAEAVFVAQGFAEARMADVAKAAGVSVGTLYNYFESKELVFASLVQARCAEFLELLQVARREEVSEPRPLHLLRVLLDHLERRSALVHLFAQLGAVSENDLKRTGGPDSEASYREYLQILEESIAAEVRAGALRADVPTRLLATALAGGINATIFNWIQDGRPAGLSERGARLYGLFLEGAKA